jgi:glycosyltransferase involved in cell wall biosynthesis
VKVCILTSVHLAFDTRIFHKQAKSLVCGGYEVTLVAPHDRDEKVEDVRVLAVPVCRTRLMRMLLTPLRILLRGLRARAVIYHFHDPELIPVGLLLHMLGKKVIYDIHEYNTSTMLTKHWIPPVLREWVSKRVWWLDRCAVGRMDGVVVVNEEMAKLFSSHVPSLQSLVVVHNYPEVPQVAWDDRDAGSEPVGIYVGSLSKERGLEVLLEAGKRLKQAHPEARLHVLGYLDFSGIREDYASVDRWDVCGVEYKGLAGHREVPKWLRRARVGLIPLFPTPNYTRATPVKLFEYMLAGLPVVASDFGIIRSIVRETGCGLLVPPGDPDALSAAVEILLRDPAKAAEMGQKGRRAVLEKYNWGAEESKLLALYGRLLATAQSQ